jgi:ABC-type dipeptide/oligopeptide/nickel transport system ATPase component
MEVCDIDLKSLIERETGNRFNRQGMICCPFHNEKTPSLKVKFLSDANKERYKCYGCGATGDAVDFIINTKGIEYPAAREYLGIPLEKSNQELEIEKVRAYIEWEIKTRDHRKGMELLGLFNFVDKDNKPMYYKAKFKAADGKKSLSYYHLDANGKVINKRNGEELLYNLYNVLYGVRNNKTIIITEGEKDANTLNSILRNHEYVATSIKGISDLSILYGAKIFVCGDTGEAGKKYIEKIKSDLLEGSEAFKVITLKGIKNLGDNKDVTDWLESGHTKSDLFQAFKRSLDLKSKFELQQDFAGIYKYVKEKGEENSYTKTYVSNFTLLEATRINFIDKDCEGVKVVLKSYTGAKIERIDTANVFDDVRLFKNFLGTLDLSFTGAITDLTTLKTWINHYFALDVEEVHTGVKFLNRDGTRIFITNDGAISKNRINKAIKSEDGTEVNITEIEEINTKEMKEVMKNLLTFATPEKTISVVGTVVNYLASEQSQSLKLKNHHLLIVGESGSGKSTILENVVAPMLNYPKTDIKSIGLITPFALIKNLSDGNYPILFDEYKPSLLDKFKNAKLSETFRNLYDRTTVSRSDKSFKNRNFQLNRPLVLVGEESYPNSEKALMERSCIVYLSKQERTQRHIDSMKWLSENETLLNKLGKSLINIILELETDAYKKIRDHEAEDIKRLKNRPLNTCINICSGVEIFNLLLRKLEVKQISNYTECITKNIEEEVLEDREEALSQVETMLIKYNSMIEDGRARDVKDVIQRKDDGLFIKTSEMLNQISEYVRSVNSTWIPLDLKDFRKQAKKSGYITGFGDKSINIGIGFDRKTIRYDSCNINKFRKLDVNLIINQEVEDVTELNNIIPFK